MKKILTALLSVVLWAGLAAPLQAETLLVAAASHMRFAFDELSDGFRQTHPDVQIKVSFGSSGTLYGQIVNGAPFDIFFSADLLYPRKLEEAGKARRGAKTALYALGGLVLWTARGSGIDIRMEKMDALSNPKVKAIAIANPRHAPYGRAALETMRHFGVYEAAKNRLARGENVSQAAQFVQAGAAQIGFIARSLAVTRRMRDSGTYWEIPASAHGAIMQGFLLLKNGKNPRAAKALAQFVAGPQGQKILRRRGFRNPD